MTSMGRRSMTHKSWKAQKCFTSEVKFLGRALKRFVKRQNALALRRQSKFESAAVSDDELCL
jgi:hypothetical protein